MKYLSVVRIKILDIEKYFGQRVLPYYFTFTLRRTSFPLLTGRFKLSVFELLNGEDVYSSSRNLRR